MKNLLRFLTTTALLLVFTATQGWGGETGGIAFTAFNADGDDNFAIVALVDIAANTTIYFSDNEPNINGTGFLDDNEGTLQWATGGSVISAGTIVIFTDTDDDANMNFGASTGTLSVPTFDSGMDLSAEGDALYAVEGSPDGNNISAWLAGIQNEANNQGAYFNETGLTVGTTFINFYSSGSPDGGYYSGSRTGETSFADYLTLLGNNTNWTTELVNGELILPISTTSFTATGVPGDPASFTATTTSTSQINLSWTQNGDTDAVMIVYNEDGTFTDPVDGTSYSVSSSVLGGTVIYNESGTSFDHQSLSSGKKYFYKAWSVDGSTNYSSGVEDNATTLADYMIIIARNCDPNNNFKADRFAEIYNAGSTSVDLTDWTLENIQGGLVSFTWALSGTILPGETKICGNADNTNQTITPDFTATWVGASWNGIGGDGTILKNNGFVVDNAVQSDGTGTFDNGQMKRKLSISDPTTSYNSTEWVFKTVSDALDVIPGFHGTVWRGIGTIWTTESNWDNEAPTSTSNVGIPGSASQLPYIATEAYCKDLVIELNAVLSIYAGYSLTVNGTLANNAGSTGLILKSDGTNGTACLIHSTADVPATVENYFTGASEAWHLLSSPVASQTISGDFTPVGTYPDLTGYDFFLWYEQSDMWVNFKNTAVSPTWLEANGSINFEVGRGYLTSYQELNPTKSFTGNLNQGAVTEALTVSGSGAHATYNLVGNPYPSSIDWRNETTGWDWSKLVTSGGGHDMYIYNSAEGNYGTYNSNSSRTAGTLGVSRYIPPCQGFVVRAATAGNFGMSNNVRVTNTQVFLKSSDEIQDHLILNVSSADISYSDETIIEFHHENDEGGAAKLLSFVSEAPSLYTTKYGENYAINFYGLPNNERVVPLNFEAGVDGNYTITATSLETFTQGTVIILEDMKVNITQELTDNSVYEFQANVNDDPARFKLHFAGSFAINETAHEDFNIYSSGSTIYINSSKNENSVIKIYNTTGQLIVSKQLNVNGLTQIELNTQTGWYVVNVLTVEESFVKKVFIN